MRNTGVGTGWKHVDQACPNSGCSGMLLLKALGADHLSVKCNRGDFTKSGRAAEMRAWLSRQK